MKSNLIFNRHSWENKESYWPHEAFRSIRRNSLLEQIIGEKFSNPFKSAERTYASNFAVRSWNWILFTFRTTKFWAYGRRRLKFWRRISTVRSRSRLNFQILPSFKGDSYYAWRAPEGLFFSSIIWNRRTSTRTVLLIDWRGRCVLSLIFKLYTLETRLPILYSHCEADVIRKPKRIWRLANKRKSTNLERFSRIRLNSRTQLSVASNETAFLLVSFFAFFFFLTPFSDFSFPYRLSRFISLYKLLAFGRSYEVLNVTHVIILE